MASAPAGTATSKRWARVRRWAAPATKTLHLVSAGAWIGCLVSVVAGSVVAQSVRDDAAFGAVAVLFRLVDRVLPWTWYATLGTGLVFSLHLKWGFFHHVWVTAKWALGSALIAAAVFWQAPVVARLAAEADLGHPGWPLANSQARNVALVLLANVAVIFAISTFKPWGRFARAGKPPRARTALLVWFATIATAAASLEQSCQLDRLRALPIEPVELAGVADGRHRGRADPEPGFPYEVEVETRGGHIVAARAIHNRTGTYPRLAEGVLERIVERQTVAVDAVTGATTTSKCLMAATRAALLAGRRR